MGKMIGADPQPRSQYFLEAHLAFQQVHHLGNLIPSVSGGNIPEHRRPSLVGQPVIQGSQIGHVVVDYRITDYHVGLGTPADRQKLCQPFTEPARGAVGLAGDQGLQGTVVKKIVHHPMHQLVMDCVAKEGIVSFKLDHDAVFRQFSDPLGGLAEGGADHVGLLPVAMRVIDDDHQPFADLPLEGAADLHIGGFGHVGGKLGQLLAAVIKIDIEMFRLKIVPVEIFVLHLVFPESVQQLGQKAKQQEDINTISGI